MNPKQQRMTLVVRQPTFPAPGFVQHRLISLLVH